MYSFMRRNQSTNLAIKAFLCRVLRRLVLLISNTAMLEANCEATQRQAESASRTAEVRLFSVYVLLYCSVLG